MPYESKEAQQKYFHDYYLKHQEKIKARAIQRRRNKLERVLLVSARYRAEKLGLAFNIEEKDIVIPAHCPILKTELKRDNSAINREFSPSLDRIDNDKGYIKGNVQVISYLANTMKSNAKPHELLLFAEWIFNTYGENHE